MTSRRTFLRCLLPPPSPPRRSPAAPRTGRPASFCAPRGRPSISATSPTRPASWPCLKSILPEAEVRLWPMDDRSGSFGNVAKSRFPDLRLVRSKDASKWSRLQRILPRELNGPIFFSTVPVLFSSPSAMSNAGARRPENRLASTESPSPPSLPNSKPFSAAPASISSRIRFARQSKSRRSESAPSWNSVPMEPLPAMSAMTRSRDLS